MSEDLFGQDGKRKGFEDRRKRLAERQHSDLRKVLGGPEGRRFVWRLMSEAGVFRSSFTGNSETFFREGKRNIGLMILGDVMVAQPDSFTVMQREAVNDKLLREQEIKNEGEKENGD
jgi:hypothetical protein